MFFDILDSGRLGANNGMWRSRQYSREPLEPITTFDTYIIYSIGSAEEEEYHKGVKVKHEKSKKFGQCELNMKQIREIVTLLPIEWLKAALCNMFSI